MKRFGWRGLAAGIALAAAAGCTSGDEESRQAAPSPQAPAAQPPVQSPVQQLPVQAARSVPPAAVASADAAQAASAAKPQGLRVNGVMFMGEANAASQALISIAGARAQRFRVGDPVAEGWSLQAVQPDHVVLAHGEQRARIHVTAGDAAATPVLGAAAAASAASRQQALPGFVPAPQGYAVPPPNLEANRKFMQDRQQRAAGARER